MSVQARAKFEKLCAKYGLNLKDGLLNCKHVYGRVAKLILEIGFGSGEALIAAAKVNPKQNYLGIEVYRPGILALLVAVEKQNIENIRIYNADALAVLENCISDFSLDEVRLFFPDPWPKRRHQKRRLVHQFFIQLLNAKMKDDGLFHFITDWKDYAMQVQKIMVEQSDFVSCQKQNTLLPLEFNESSWLDFAIFTTKFARRCVQSGRKIYELLFKKSI